MILKFILKISFLNQILILLYIQIFLKNPLSKKKYLIVREPPIIIPQNHNPKKLRCFSKVFTWNDNLVDNDFFIKYYNQSYDFDKVKFINNIKDKDGFVLICSNKISSRKGENYSTRNKVINFFENTNFNFNFYGIGWNKRRFSNRFIEAFFNKSKIVRPPNRKYKNYKGIVENKRLKSAEYNFEFAIENTNNINGYVTEKIFDPFFSNTIPIYSGSPNITDYIPKNCFINLDEFNNIEDLLQFTQTLSKDDLKRYILNKHAFFKTESLNTFSSDFNAKILISSILNDL